MAAHALDDERGPMKDKARKTALRLPERLAYTALGAVIVVGSAACGGESNPTADAATDVVDDCSASLCVSSSPGITCPTGNVCASECPVDAGCLSVTEV
jgi:hypothetical protein